MNDQLTLDLAPLRVPIAALPASHAGSLDLPVEYADGREYHHRRNGWCLHRDPAYHASCPRDWFTYRWDRCDCPCHVGGAA